MQKSASARGFLALCCFTHFAVDFACALLLLRLFPDDPLWFLLYNFCAFALQMPLGLLADRLGRPHLLAAAGCLLSAAAFLLPPLPLAAVLTAGIGNALFHVGAGLAVMNGQGGWCGPLGLFVSPGALGLFLGAALADDAKALFLLPSLLLLASAALLGGWGKTGSLPQNAPFSPALSLGGLVPACCLFLVVWLRSLCSLSLALPWKGEGAWALPFALCTLLGKALGGLLAERFGVGRIALLSLLGSALLFPFSGAPVMGLGAVLLFNMTMPLTLWALARLLPGAKGFAFGLLTFSLFLGFLPGWLHTGLSFSPAGAALAAALSLPLLWAGLRKSR